MPKTYQRWTPPCGCSFEQEVDTDTGEVTLLFSHEICGGHEDIAKNTPVPKTVDKQKNDIIKAKHDAWQRNKVKNESDFENHEKFNKIKQKVNSIGLQNLNQNPNIQALYNYYLEEKQKHIDQVNKFTNDKSIDLLLGLESPYALNGHEVYNKVVTENQSTESSNEKVEGG
jgi:hypothetical protein